MPLDDNPLSPAEREVVAIVREAQSAGSLQPVVARLSNGDEASRRAREALLLLIELDPEQFVTLLAAP